MTDALYLQVDHKVTKHDWCPVYRVIIKSLSMAGALYLQGEHKVMSMAGALYLQGDHKVMSMALMVPVLS